jgi:predicted nuclease of predicted toxin-antitoxin system
MAIRGVKFDEDLSPMVAEPVRKAGFTVATVVDHGWSGLKDEELWSRVVAEGFFFVTADKGFADIRSRPPGDHPGILLLRPNRESVVDLRAIVEAVLAKHDLNSLSGTIAVATPREIRIRRPRHPG